ncbi:hypothetical protein TNIN_474791 [Trichonephila inaurata madagascariensis]|uniref:Uncharacterized protein n=1 Tax=Trichonephila inaurata madagascariensis TaxID=2747483 RepID=A0A8X6YWN6_9ARAC|nr:hypothetical protein TNIN_474791 [Trichonephila inaurata madagascariensis]
MLRLEIFRCDVNFEDAQYYPSLLTTCCGRVQKPDDFLTAMKEHPRSKQLFIVMRESGLERSVSFGMRLSFPRFY